MNAFVEDSAEVLARFLMSSDEEHEPEIDSAINNFFPPDVWHSRQEQILYSSDAYNNLLTAEMGKGFRSWLVDRGFTAESYGAELGPVQYSAVRAKLKSVFPDQRGNAGWQLVLLGFPSLKTIVFGLSHNYNGETSQNKLGSASALLRKSALSQLSDSVAEIASQYRSAEQADWDDSGLMKKPVLSIAGIDISTYDNSSGAKLRFVRNTTAKKDLACFFFLDSALDSEFNALSATNVAESHGSLKLRELIEIAIELAEKK